MIISHNQSTPSNKWTITHNQNAEGVLIDVFIYHEGALRKVVPRRIIEVSRNEVEIRFTENQYGTATLAFVL